MSEVVLDYLEGLSATSLPELYNNVCSCVAVLRCLPPLSRQILMRLAFVDQVTFLHLDTVATLPSDTRKICLSCSIIDRLAGFPLTELASPS